VVASLAFLSYSVWYSPWRRIGSLGVAPEGSGPSWVLNGRAINSVIPSRRHGFPPFQIQL